MSVTPEASWPRVKALLHSILDQPDAASVHARFDRVLDTLAGMLPPVAEHLDAARADLLAFTAFPKGIWCQMWSEAATGQPRSPSSVRSTSPPGAHRRGSSPTR